MKKKYFCLLLLFIQTIIVFSQNIGTSITIGDITYNVISENPNKANVVAGNPTNGDLEIREVVRVNGQDYTVISISNEAFKDKSNIERVVMPISMETIGASAFLNCSGLNTVSLPVNLKTIKNKAFSNTGLISINVVSNVLNVGDGLFENCSLLETASVPKATRNMFKNCLSLKNITINHPNSTNIIIGESAFANCTVLNNVTIPEFIESISKNAFQSCANLVDIRFLIV